MKWFRQNSYQMISWDASAWLDETDALRNVGDKLDFPWTPNLDGMNDFMHDVTNHEFGWDRDASGLVLVLRHFDTFAIKDERTAWTILDIFAHHSRQASLVGDRLVVLLETDDPLFEIRAVGASGIHWDRFESNKWSRKKWEGTPDERP
jgi:hypothetical protein